MNIAPIILQSLIFRNVNSQRGCQICRSFTQLCKSYKLFLCRLSFLLYRRYGHSWTPFEMQSRLECLLYLFNIASVSEHVRVIKFSLWKSLILSFRLISSLQSVFPNVLYIAFFTQLLLNNFIKQMFSLWGIPCGLRNVRGK